MTSITTPEGLEANIVSGGDATVQAMCDILNRTHFGGALPPISAFAASRLEHPTLGLLPAITLKSDEVSDLRGLGTPWLVLIHERFCMLPFVAQLLLHEMTHVSLPDESPYHSERFWTVLKEKWLVDFSLISGVGLNEDEAPNGLTKQILDIASLHRSLGL